MQMCIATDVSRRCLCAARYVPTLRLRGAGTHEPRGGEASMSRLFLPCNTSRARLKAAERARAHRAEIVRELSWGRISRRELIKMGLFTSAGLLAPIRGLNPFVSDVSAQIP